MNRKGRKRKPRRAFIPGVCHSFGAYFRVLPTLFKYKLWPMQLLPALISLLLTTGMFGLFWLIGTFIDNWIDVKVDLIPLDFAGKWYSDLWDWAEVDRIVSSTVGALVFIFLCIGFLFVHKHVILVLLSPLLGKLAEATYQRVMNDQSTSPLTITQSFSRGVRLNTGNLFKEVTINILFLACNFIPGFGQILAGVGVFVNQSRFIGYSLMDTTIEHKGLNVRESLDFVRRRNGHSVGLGAVYIVMMFIPILGWMFAPTLGTIAGTLVAIDEFEWDDDNCFDGG